MVSASSGQEHQISAGLALKINRACLVLEKADVTEMNRDRLLDHSVTFRRKASAWTDLPLETPQTRRDNQLRSFISHIIAQPHSWQRLKTALSKRRVPVVGSSLWAVQRILGSESYRGSKEEG